MKGTADASTTATALREVVRAIDATLPVADIRTMADVVAESVGERRFLMTLVLLFAISAGFLAGLGIYGVVSQSVKSRTVEIGVRLAMGASRRSVLRLVLGETGRFVGIGLAAGLTLALLTARWLRSVLFEVAPNDPATITAACVLLACGALAAALVPARRAATIDPAFTLRSE